MNAKSFSAPVARRAPAVTAKPATRPPARTPARTPAAASAVVGVPRFAANRRPATEVKRREQALAPTAVHDVLRSPGRPLEPATRQAMEARLGHDLGRVRVHTDARAADSARAVGARAFTVNQHVVFAAGQYAPATADGNRLLAHELVHTLQQPQATTVTTEALRLAAPGDATEIEARRLARGPRAVGQPVKVTPAGRLLARQPLPGLGGVPQPRQRLEMAKEFLRQVPGGPAMLNGLVEHRVVIELRSATGTSSLYRIENPMKETGKLAWSRDGNDWELLDLANSSGEGKAPRIVLDENQTAGDLALNLFRGRQQARWAAADPQTLDASVRADDQATARAEYAKGMTENVVSRNFEQLQLKVALQAQGASVSTPLFLESEYRLAYNQAFAAGMSQHGSAKRAASDATSAAYRAIKDAVESGQVRTHTQEKYRDHFGQAWDQERAAWAQREPEKAAAGQVRHETATKIKTLVALTNTVDPKSADAENVILQIDAFAREHGGATRVLFMGSAREGLMRLLKPFGYRTVIGPNIGSLMRQRLDYALANFRALRPADRRRLLQEPSRAEEYGIRTEPTADELAAEGRVVAIRKLPDGTLHTGTLDEFREASEVNRINHALGQLNAIANSGPGSLLGRIVDGERGAAYGAGADAFLAIRGSVKARARVRAQIRTGTNLPRTSNVGPGGRGSSAPLEPIGHRAPAPPREPMPAPRPVRLGETEVVAANVRHQASIRVQSPTQHQQAWTAFGGEGTAPLAYRHAGDAVYLSSASRLIAPATRSGNPPFGPQTSPPTPPAPKTPTPPAPKPVVGKADPNIGFDKTGEIDALAKTPSGPMPAPPVAPAGKAPPGPQTSGTGPRPKFRFHPEVPPQAVSQATLQRLQHLVRYSVNSERHNDAWALLNGRGDAPPAFISERIIYVDATRPLPP